jgi:hypothetical protein
MAMSGWLGHLPEDVVIRIAIHWGNSAIPTSLLVHTHLLRHLRDDATVMFEAIRHDSLLLRLASHRLRDDPELVRHAMLHPDEEGGAFRYASIRLRGDAQFIRELFLDDGTYLLDWDFVRLYASPQLTNDEAFMEPFNVTWDSNLD